ncbi:hypothetical protein BDD12DRAFT_928499 [Trichophaea hybrida]|nr:hypothetical protein BDD12DRAFT_928499 [Trichophaea hybrida]
MNYMGGRNYGHQGTPSMSTSFPSTPTGVSCGSSSPTTIPHSTCITCENILDELQELGKLPTVAENSVETASTSAFSLAVDSDHLRVQLKTLIDRYRPLPSRRSSVDSITTNSMDSSSSKGSLRGAVKAIKRASTLSFGREPRVRPDTFNLVAFSPTGQVVAAAVDITNSRSPLKTKLMITKSENPERRNRVSTFTKMHQEPRDDQIKTLAVSDSFVAVGSDAGFELHSVSEGTRSFSQPFEQMVKAVALFHNKNLEEDFVCIGTGDKRVYHSRILRKDNPNAPEERYKLAIDEKRQWIEMKLDNRDRAAIVTYSQDGDRICVGSTNGKIYIFNIDGTLASPPYRLPISSGENKAFTFAGLCFIDTDRVICGILTDTGSGGNFPAIIDFSHSRPTHTALRTDRRNFENRANIHALCVSKPGDVPQIAFVERDEVKVYQRYLEVWKEVTVKNAKIPNHMRDDGVALVFRSSTELLVLDRECTVKTLCIPHHLGS